MTKAAVGSSVLWVEFEDIAMGREVRATKEDLYVLGHRAWPFIHSFASPS